MCTVGEKEREERFGERGISAISPPIILWAQMSSPNEKKWDAPNKGRKHFVPYMFSLPLLFLPFCHCLVLFLHLPITSWLLLVGCQWVEVTRHRSPAVEWTQPLGHGQTHAYSDDSCTTQQRWYMSYKCLHSCAFVGDVRLQGMPCHEGCCSTVYVVVFNQSIKKL